MKPDLDALRESGRISSLARETCKQMIVPGAKIEDHQSVGGGKSDKTEIGRSSDGRAQDNKRETQVADTAHVDLPGNGWPMVADFGSVAESDSVAESESIAVAESVSKSVTEPVNVSVFVPLL